MSSPDDASVTKAAFVVRDGDGVSELCDWARRQAERDEMTRAELERVDEGVQRQHTAKPAWFQAMAVFWAPPSSLGELVGSAPKGCLCYRLDERLAFDRSARRDEARPWSGVKKTTFWRAASGVDTATWQGRYTNHGLIAAAYHRTTVRYRQNFVASGPDIPFDAVSELWWTNEEDLIERFVDSEEGERLLSIDFHGFLDPATAYPTVSRHEILRLTG
jgi:hypothetical protein